MFQNQSYKQKLSYTKNDNTDDVVNINITLNTNHELEKNIINDIEAVVSGMFLSNYTDTEDLIKEEKEENLRLKMIQQEAKEVAKREREQIKHNEKMRREDEKRQKEYEKKNEEDRKRMNAPRNWGNKRRNN